MVFLSKRISSTATATPSVSLAPTRFPNLCYYSRFQLPDSFPFSVQNLPETPPRHFPPPRARGGFLWRRNNSNKQIRSNYNEATNTSIPPPNPPSPRRCCQRMRVGYKPQNLLVVRVRVTPRRIVKSITVSPFSLFLFLFVQLVHHNCSRTKPHRIRICICIIISSILHIALHPPLIISDIHSTPLSFNLHASPTNLQDFWA